MRRVTTAELAILVGGELKGDSARTIERLAPLDEATPDALSLIASARYLPYLQATRAGAVLVPSKWLGSVPERCVAVVVEEPHRALQAVLTELYRVSRPEPGIHPSAVISESVRLGAEIHIGPHVVVGEEVSIGDRASIGANSVICAGCTIGDDVIIHPNVTLYEGVVIENRVIVHAGARLGKDGFGFVWKDGGHRKVPQVGGCVIEEDVEIGANVTIDRGSIGDTVVGAGTKLDNLVHIGHNVRVGRNVLVVAQAGIAGSTRIGDGAVLGGQAGIAGHLDIGPGARLGAQAGAISDVPAGATYSGYPARPHRESLRGHAAVFKLPEFFRRLKRLEERVFGRAVEANDEGKPDRHLPNDDSKTTNAGE